MHSIKNGNQIVIELVLSILYAYYKNISAIFINYFLRKE